MDTQLDSVARSGIAYLRELLNSTTDNWDSRPDGDTVPMAIGAGTEDRNRPYWEGLVSYDSSNEKSTDELREFSEEYWYLTRAESAMHFILLTIEGIHQHLLTIDDEENIIDEYPSTPKPKR